VLSDVGAGFCDAFPALARLGLAFCSFCAAPVLAVAVPPNRDGSAWSATITAGVTVDLRGNPCALSASASSSSNSSFSSSSSSPSSSSPTSSVKFATSTTDSAAANQQQSILTRSGALQTAAAAKASKNAKEECVIA
jgi:hypothetical protein